MVVRVLRDYIVMLSYLSDGSIEDEYNRVSRALSDARKDKYKMQELTKRYFKLEAESKTKVVVYTLL